MASELIVEGSFEIVAVVEDLITLRSKACVRIVVVNTANGAVLYEGFKLMEVPE